MDSISQAALGAAVGMAVMGRRTALWKSALWGAVCGTLPDLDALIDHGDPVSNMTYHRAESHALFWLTLAAPPLAAVIARLHGEIVQWRRWWLAVWLVLVTHPLLDAMTVYGTQLLLPFTDRPYGLGSIFIIDPLYTVPLLIGVWVALRRADARGLAWNRAGLLASCAYLAWTAAAQAWVRADVEHALQADGISAQQILVTPAPFNSLLWRVVAVAPGDRFLEGFRSLLDGDRPLRLDAFDRGNSLLPEFANQWHVQRMVWFTGGFYKLQRADGGVVITDLRMGQEPGYVFSFLVPSAQG
ncbi:MAG: metal-dependent hydrolase, partial [Rhizobacter sp.]|nr:metal-dependent hydrolase [Rhizobacter sp.]